MEGDLLPKESVFSSAKDRFFNLGYSEMIETKKSITYVRHFEDAIMSIMFYKCNGDVVIDSSFPKELSVVSISLPQATLEAIALQVKEINKALVG